MEGFNYYSTCLQEIIPKLEGRYNYKGRTYSTVFDWNNCFEGGQRENSTFIEDMVDGIAQFEIKVLSAEDIISTNRWELVHRTGTHILFKNMYKEGYLLRLYEGKNMCPKQDYCFITYIHEDTGKEESFKVSNSWEFNFIEEHKIQLTIGG